MAACDLADTPKIWALHMFFQMAFAVGREEIHPADNSMGKSTRIRIVRNGLKPSRLADRIFVVVVGLDVNRFDHVLLLNVVEKIFDEIVHAKSCVGPPDSNGFGALHVGIVVIVYIPKMMMGIDELHRKKSLNISKEPARMKARQEILR